jgi:hypothetical protein
MFQFLSQKYGMSDELISDLLSYQNYGTVDPYRSYPCKINISHNIHEVIFNGATLEKSEKSYIFKAKEYNGNLFDWGKETLWWGRRVAANKIKPKLKA